MLHDFEIKGFRTFSHVRIERLGSVNLIAGRNNVGKTTLLEAIRLFAQGGSPVSLWDVLRKREELALDSAEDDHVVVESLFHGRSQNGKLKQEFSLGSIGPTGSRLAVAITPLREVLEKTPDLPSGFIRYEPATPSDDPTTLVAGLVISSRAGQRVLPLADMDRTARRRFRQSNGFEPAFISATGAERSEVVRWWDSISLTDSEDRIVECLQLLAPVERITPVEHRPSGRGERIFRVRLSGHRAPVPLKSLGDGVQRMFQVAVALEFAGQALRAQDVFASEPKVTSVPARPFLFIDEVENGIHYTALARLWQFIFRVARDRGVQVFATTHSWDCIEGFQKAAAAEPECDPMLIRLEMKDNRSRAVLFDKSELPVVVREQIEVR